ncbi:hypothetical protein, partial [Methylobacterium radiotolerans]|uniref:hypothetical protein n=1 Tax=Methylobacterium radiotolerans TaxID=31998 RepID=UPI001AECB0B3
KKKRKKHTHENRRANDRTPGTLGEHIDRLLGEQKNEVSITSKIEKDIVNTHVHTTATVIEHGSG